MSCIKTEESSTTTVPVSQGKVTARYPSDRSKHVTLINGMACVKIGLEHRPLRPIFQSIYDANKEHAVGLIYGITLGDLIGQMIHKRGCFNVIAPRAIKSGVLIAAKHLGRDVEVWDCGPDEDPDGWYFRSEFAEATGPKMSL